MRLSIRSKIILPFFILLLFVGTVGTAVVSAQVTTATVAEFDGGLLRTSVLGNDALAVLEAERLAQLREAVDTEGVAEAISAGDRPGLTRLLLPIVSNAQPARLIVRALDRQGRLLLALPATAEAPVGYAGILAVQEALAGRADTRGDKYVFLATDGPGEAVYWAGPVRNEQREPVGAILLGESLAEIADSLRTSRASEVVFYDPAGRVLTSSLEPLPALRGEALERATGDRPVRFTETLGGHAYTFLVADWTMRDVRLGYFAVALNADAMQASLGQVRGLLAVIFVCAALFTLLLGSALARYITRPLDHLVTAMRAVSAGDLTQRTAVRSRDEIGYLARSFNTMTASLEEKTRALEETYFASMEALARAIDARDPSTFGHSTRVAAISLEIADAMGLPPAEREALRRGALLHDIGKIGVEDRVLRKPLPLNDDEWDAMRRHPAIGHAMIRDLRFLEPSLKAVLHHHERWDGGGYPEGLRAEGIPLMVRVLSVADSLDAMTSDRPYRRGLSVEAALRAITAAGGSEFEPAVVAALGSRKAAVAELLRKMGRRVQPGPEELAAMEKAG